MPHITFEYTDNLDVDTKAFFGELHARIAATGEVAMRALKSRALRHADWHIADGDEAYAFAHLNLLIRGGRSAEAKDAIAKAAMEVLEEKFGKRRESGYISLSVDIKEMREGESITRHNIPDRSQEAAR